ncbi:MAG: hypothetical protein M3019_10085 [Candidatus Dormibacteraeota bacterium]|nr:hypothetical protein [Candidatus Dormibacteraeota bacterium]
MAARKRRRPAAKPRPAAVAVEAAPSPEPATPPRRRPAAPVNDARDVPWTGRGMLALLGLVFLLQLPIGVVINLTSHTNPLIIDVFFFQPQYLVVACVVMMRLARRLTGQARNLRLLESLSLGVMYALLSLMLSTVFVHPANASVSTDQFIRNLKLSDGLLIALSDVIALFATVTLYPGFSRLLGTPGRRARARMQQRSGAASPAPKAAGRNPGGRPATSKGKARPRP